MTEPLYLDHNATSPVRGQVAALMAELQALPLNPSSVHGMGRKARQVLADARKGMAERLSVFAHELIFTASATEANNMALCGFPDRTVLVSAVEHPSVLWATESAPALSRVKVSSDGLLDLEHLDSLLSSSTTSTLTSIQLANNETGVIQPVREISRIVRKHNGLLHVDAVQATGKIPLDAGMLGADLITISGHKCGGPVGAAALIVRGNIPIAPLLKGGRQEQSRRAGTENVAAIAGFALALELAQDFTHMRQLAAWRDAMEREMLACAPTSIIWGRNAPRLPNTSCISMPNVENELQLMDFDLRGMMVSAGSACSSGRIEPSYVLLAMGATGRQAKSAIRISSGWNTLEPEILRFTAAWKALYQRLNSPMRDS